MKCNKDKMFVTKIMAYITFIGILGIVYLIFKSTEKLPTSIPIVTPCSSPYKNFISANGIIESKSDNVEIGTQICGIVDKIFVKVKDKVKKGDKLFKLDTRTEEAEIKSKEAALFKAEALLKQAKASFKVSKKKYQMAKKVEKANVISEDDFLSRKLDYIEKTTNLESCKAEVLLCASELNASKVKYDLLTVKAPIDGEILQVNIHPGEWAAQAPTTGSYKASFSQDPLILLGDFESMHIRIDIDENDAWRFKKGAKAIAMLRGNPNIKFDLIFQRIEPYAVPKTSLSGQSFERVDTRVLQVIYAFDPKNAPIFIGQQVDVFIDSDV